MAYDVTSEWDDIHRKLGNYEALPVEKKQSEYVQENIDKLEELYQHDIDSDDSMISDDEFFEQYKRQKLESAEEKIQEEENKGKVFGWVNEISAIDYVREVNNAGEGIVVILNLYQNHVQTTVQINEIFEELSKKFLKVKFLKSVATRCNESIPDSALPKLLVYQDGKMLHQIDRRHLGQLQKLTAYSMEHLFGMLGIQGFELKGQKVTGKGFVHDKMGKQEQDREEYDSDEEQREDRQYISNKLFVKYQLISLIYFIMKNIFIETAKIVLKTTDSILNEQTDNQTLSILLIILKCLLLSPVYMLHNQSNFEEIIGNTLSKMIKIFLPYKYFNDVSESTAIIILLIFLAYYFVLIGGLVLLSKKEQFVEFKALYGSLIYFFDYFISYQIFGFVLIIMKSVSVFSTILKITFIIISALILLINTVIVIVVSLFFFNFKINSDDFLARHSNPVFFGLKLIQVVIIVIDVIYGNNIDLKLALIINLIYSTLFFLDISFRFPYYKYQTNIFAILTGGLELWFVLSFLVAEFVPIQLINENVHFIILAGSIFIIWTYFSYRDKFYQTILNQNTAKILNDNYMDKQIRFFIKLLSSSLSNKQEEMRLASMIEYHITFCKDTQCICKSRKKIFNSKTSKYEGRTECDFKDEFFIKFLGLQILQKSLKRFPKSKILNINLVLYYMEITRNIPKATEELARVLSFIQINFIDKIQLWRINLCIDQCIELISKENHQQLQIENIKIYDNLIDTLNDQMFSLTENYSLFWNTLCNKISNNKQLENVCSSILLSRKKIKKIFKTILEITQDNQEFFKVILFFYKYITYEPLQVAYYEKKLSYVMEQLYQEESNQLIDKNSFIIELSISKNSVGKILWVSTNSENVIGYEAKQMHGFHISKLQPRIVAQHHDSILNEFHERGQLYQREKSIIYALNNNKKLFQANYLIKMIHQREVVTLIAYIKKMDSRKFLIANEKGEIDSFGSYFETITNINYYFPFTYQNISLLYFIPSFIPFFLPLFYKVKDFKINHLRIEEMTSVYLFTYNNLENRLVQMSKLINDKIQTTSYVNILYEIMSNLQFSDVESVHQIDFTFTKQGVDNQSVKFNYYVLEIQKYNKLIPSSEIFNQQKLLIEKLNMNKQNKYSLERYKQRILEKSLRDVENKHIDKTSTVSKFHQVSLGPSLESVQLQTMKDIMKQQKSLKDDENDRLFDFEDDQKRLKATNIIKKLFVKSFHPGGDESNWSPNKKKWVKVINKYHGSKNKFLGTFIENHIEQLPKEFKKEIFFPANQITRNEFKIVKKNSVHEQNADMNKSQSTNKTPIDQILLTQNKIKVNQKSKKKQLKILRNIYLISIICVLLISTIGYQLSSMYSNVFLDSDTSNQVYQYEKFLTIFIMTTAFSKYKRFFLTPSDTKNDVYDKTTQRLLMNRKILENMMEQIWTSFKDKQSYFIQMDSNPNIEQLFPSMFEELNYNTSSIISSQIEYQMKVVDFLEYTRVMVDYEDFNTSPNNMMISIERNLVPTFLKIFEMDSDFDNKIQQEYHSFMSSIQYILYLVLLCQYMILFVVMFLAFKVLIQADSIYDLFSKIEIEKSQFYKHYFRELVFHFKICQKPTLLEILQDFKFTKRRRQVRNKMREFKRSNFKKYIWFLKLLLVNSILLIPTLIKYFYYQDKVEILYNQYVFLNTVAFYDIHVSISYFLTMDSVYFVKYDPYVLNNIIGLPHFGVPYKTTFDSVIRKTYFFSYEKLFALDQEFKDFQTSLYNNDYLCEYLQTLGLCEDKLVQSIVKISFQTMMADHIQFLQNFYRVYTGKLDIALLWTRPRFLQKFRDIMYRSFTLNEILLLYSYNISEQISRLIKKMNDKMIFFLYIEILCYIISIFLFIVFVYRDIKRLSIRNNSFIKLIPLDIIVNNQYFKIYLKGKK